MHYKQLCGGSSLFYICTDLTCPNVMGFADVHPLWSYIGVDQAPFACLLCVPPHVGQFFALV